jgi:hypothetical protein
VHNSGSRVSPYSYSGKGVRYPISTRDISTSFPKSSCRPKRQIRLFKSLFGAFPDQRITPTEIETFLVLRL